MKEKPTIAISPISNDYLTEGKEYKIIEWGLDNDYFFIIDDRGEERFCLVEYCAHIGMRKWILKQQGMKTLTIYAIIDSENNLVSTTHKEKQAIETADILGKANKTKYKVVACNGLVVV